MKNFIKEAKYTLILLLWMVISVVFSIVIPVALIYLVSFKIVLFVISYFLLTYILWKWLRKKIFRQLFMMPVLIIDFLFEIIHIIPINLIFGNIIIFISFPIMIVFYANLGMIMAKFPVNVELRVYFSLLFLYLFYVTFNKLVLSFIAKISIARYKNSKKLKPYNIKEISEYLLSQANMKVLIYVLNIVAIIFINFFRFQNFDFSEKILLFEKPILQSLITFIAFDRAISLLNQLEFRPSIFYKKIWQGIKSKDEDLRNRSIK